MLIRLTVETEQHTKLTIYWTIQSTPQEWEVKLKAKQLAKSVGQDYRSHISYIVSK